MSERQRVTRKQLERWDQLVKLPPMRIMDVRDTALDALRRIEAARTVLENMRVTTDPMTAQKMTDIEQRRVNAIAYLNGKGAP